MMNSPSAFNGRIGMMYGNFIGDKIMLNRKMASSHLDNSKLIVSGDGALSAVAVHYSVSRLD